MMRFAGKKKLEEMLANPMAAISNKKISCLICGQEMRALSPAHLLMHGHTAQSYKQMFGYPEWVILAGQEIVVRRWQRRNSGKNLPPTPVMVKNLWDEKKSAVQNCKRIAGLLGVSCAQVWQTTSRYAEAKLKKLRKNPLASIGEDKIVCLECGHDFQHLQSHLRQIHSMAMNDYRCKWRLPDNLVLASRNYLISFFLPHAQKIHPVGITPNWVKALWDYNKKPKENYQSIGDLFGVAPEKVAALWKKSQPLDYTKLARLRQKPMAAIGERKITCLICGWSGRSLSTGGASHLQVRHKMSAGEYRQKWGYAPKLPLACRNYLKKQRQKNAGLKHHRSCGVTPYQFLNLMVSGFTLEEAGAEYGIHKGSVSKILQHLPFDWKKERELTKNFDWRKEVEANGQL
jgi:predicted transcriptional regulator